MAIGSSRKPRTDALHNRRRVLDSAHTIFAEQGLEASMTSIARRAGVGVATLYRHFPTKSDLLAEVSRDQVAECVSVIDHALDDPDPWRGFTTVIEKICAMQAKDRGLGAVFLEALPDPVLFETERIRAENGFAELARRAKDVGRLRPDFVRDDLTLVMMANRGITAATEAEALATSRRLSAYLIQAFEARPERAPLPPVPRLGPHPDLPSRH